MIDRFERVLKLWRRKISRSHWLARRLGLPSHKGSPTRPGLVMIQIDGLSQQEFRKALYRGELPFLKRLIDREHYQEHSHYSGLPSCTPAVQAEIFYGVKTSVPAFAFKDAERGRIVRMYEPAVAASVEASLLERCDEPLLKDGSAYCNNFSGGAAEAHFCASTLGMKAALEAANPFSMFLLIVTNLASVVRILGLIAVELGVALWDFAKGPTNIRDFLKELKFIPTRVGVCILLRELLVIGGRIDIERGLPIVHLNFIGFDEQAHRRGPRSAFAHWSLKGIDYAIKRLWKSAQRAPWRQYDVWVYSDHGQCVTKPFYHARGYDIEEALNQSFAKLGHDTPPVRRLFKSSTDVQRCCLLGSHDIAGGHVHRIHDAGESLEAQSPGQKSHEEESPQPEVAALGPVGLIYPDRQYTRQELGIVAEILATEHKVPVVITETEEGTLLARTDQGHFVIPDQMAGLFGEDHPFLVDMGEDLVRLCRHPNAGDMVILGWRPGVESLSFVTENGSHAGLTPEETNPFSLLPRDTQLPESDKNYLRPTELRAAALHFLGRKRFEKAPRWDPFINIRQGSLKVMTYNVHSCVGLDGKLDLVRISRVIALEKPDVVALQELDLLRARSGKDDQAQIIAALLEMNYQFHPAMHLEEEQYGDAILTHLPMRTVKVGVLPGTKPDSKREPRGAIWVVVNVNGTDVHIVNTHLGLSRREQSEQVHELLSDTWLKELLASDEPVILCGDFNAGSTSRAYKALTAELRDVQKVLTTQRPKKTFYSRFPSVRIDHIFINEAFDVVSVDVPRHNVALTASDHLPLVAELRLVGNAQRG